MSYGLMIQPNRLRIMRDASYNALTTAINDYDKFAFNSENGNLAYAYGIGANPNGLSYYPLVTSMAQFESGWWDLQSFIKYAPSTGAGISHTCNYARMYQDIRNGGSRSVAVGHQFQSQIASGSDTFRGANPIVPIDTKVLVWQLPADGSGYPFPTSAGDVAGVYISPTAIRVPRSGYSVFDSNPAHFILHENMRPAKIITAGSIFLPSGGPVTVVLPGVMPGNVFVGGQISNPGAPVLIPHVDEAGYSFPTPERRVQVSIGSSSLTFRERNGVSVQVSYYVVAEDNAGNSSGVGPVIETSAESGIKFARIVKPGTTGNRFADILVDSRWKTMPLIASGFVSRASFSSPSGIAPLGNKSTAAVSVPAMGYAPLVLANWWFDRYDASGHLDRIMLEGRVTFGIETASGNLTSGTQMFTGWSCYTKVQDTLLTFTNFFANPTAWTASAYLWASLRPTRTLFDDFVGVQYYAFAIPQS